MLSNRGYLYAMYIACIYMSVFWIDIIYLFIYLFISLFKNIVDWDGFYQNYSSK